MIAWLMPEGDFREKTATGLLIFNPQVSSARRRATLNLGAGAAFSGGLALSCPATVRQINPHIPRARSPSHNLMVSSFFKSRRRIPFA
jgi:hypothetical protein